MPNRSSNDHERRPPNAQRRRRVLWWGSRILLGLTIVPIALGVGGAIYQTMATAADQRTYPAPGRLVDVGGYRLHLHCAGEGAPTVVLDALFPGTVSNWIRVQPDIARTTRVCAYDRAGHGWSERGALPRDAENQARELRALLANAGVAGPYVVVGHSLGGLTVRMFAAMYPNDVSGMVLIEGTNPDAWRRLGRPEGVGVDRNQLAVAPFLARLGVFRLGLIPLYAADPDLPPRQRLELQAFFDSVKALQTIRDVDVSFSTALDQVRHAGGIGSKPLAVVVGSLGDGAVEALRELFVEQAALSTNSVTRVVGGATHSGLVANRAHAAQTSGVILQVVEAARTGRLLEGRHP